MPPGKPKRPAASRKTPSPARSPTRDFAAQVTIPSNHRDIAKDAPPRHSAIAPSRAPQNETLLEALRLGIQALQQQAMKENLEAHKNNAGTQAGESALSPTRGGDVKRDNIQSSGNTLKWTADTEYRQNFRNLTEFGTDTGLDNIPVKEPKASTSAGTAPAGIRRSQSERRPKLGNGVAPTHDEQTPSKPLWWGHHEFTPAPDAIRGAALQFLKERERRLNRAVDAPGPEKTPFAERVPATAPGERRWIGLAGERTRVEGVKASWNGTWDASASMNGPQTSPEDEETGATTTTHPVRVAEVQDIKTNAGSPKVSRGNFPPNCPPPTPLQPALRRSKSVEDEGRGRTRNRKPRPEEIIPITRYGGMGMNENEEDGRGWTAMSVPQRSIDEATQTLPGAKIDPRVDLAQPVDEYDASRPTDPSAQYDYAPDFRSPYSSPSRPVAHSPPIRDKPPAWALFSRPTTPPNPSRTNARGSSNGPPNQTQAQPTFDKAAAATPKATMSASTAKGEDPSFPPASAGSPRRAANAIGNVVRPAGLPSERTVRRGIEFTEPAALMEETPKARTTKVLDSDFGSLGESKRTSQTATGLRPTQPNDRRNTLAWEDVSAKVHKVGRSEPYRNAPEKNHVAGLNRSTDRDMDTASHDGDPGMTRAQSDSRKGSREELRRVMSEGRQKKRAGAGTFLFVPLDRDPEVQRSDAPLSEVADLGKVDRSPPTGGHKEPRETRETRGRNPQHSNPSNRPTRRDVSNGSRTKRSSDLSIVDIARALLRTGIVESAKGFSKWASVETYAAPAPASASASARRRNEGDGEVDDDDDDESVGSGERMERIESYSVADGDERDDRYGIEAEEPLEFEADSFMDGEYRHTDELISGA
ncbi:hypothetical protein M427DRAFT_66636 [Gonapodya prolifera JEL478]|uniref:Uncharacterized protein n=1 Tax=Gonapodya prolifera (strain JEL478) TaxID=1344416 RepID=A0A139ATK6_GONPJ|nr:hypothetical protein M427DRAFT_66636 [Gonapodya prolifera JEL478]|eukprot:KXS20024.1 hypothetical protein M427DRAFT_66636 [Gonapodya prolifera JEL478]